MKRILFLLSFFFVYSSASVFSQGDECSGAFQITSPASFCTTQEFSNVTSTPTGLAKSSCWSTGTYNDVWFVFL